MAMQDEYTRPDTASEPASDTPNQRPTAPSATAGGRVGRLSRLSKRVLFFGALAVLTLFLYVIANLDKLAAFFYSVGNILKPLVVGGVIAYLCNPILVFYEYRVFKRMKKGGLRRGLSLTLTVLTALAIVTLVVMMIIPELLSSLGKLIANSDAYVNDFINYLQGIVDGLNARLPVDINIGDVRTMVSGVFNSVEQWLLQLADGNNLGAVGGTLLDVLTGIFDVFKNLLMGTFIAFYLLASKEKRKAQIAKFRTAMFNKNQNQRISEFFLLTDRCFGGFIFGKIIDSLVIGFLTFILMTLFKVSEYNLLIATFIGVTNVIPVFGPLIGAVPSAFIVLISNPSKALLFILLVLVIQQLDSNIIAPKILGDNTGVSSLCVIIAITICGSIWGVPGMILGVPLFAVVIEWIKRLLELRLKEKGKSTDTRAYYPRDAIGDAEQDLYYENASLRYYYEHSGMKPHVDRVKDKLFREPEDEDPTESEYRPPKEPRVKKPQEDVQATTVLPHPNVTPPPPQAPSPADNGKHIKKGKKSKRKKHKK